MLQNEGKNIDAEFSLIVVVYKRIPEQKGTGAVFYFLNATFSPKVFVQVYVFQFVRSLMAVVELEITARRTLGHDDIRVDKKITEKDTRQYATDPKIYYRVKYD